MLQVLWEFVMTSIFNVKVFFVKWYSTQVPMTENLENAFSGLLMAFQWEFPKKLFGQSYLIEFGLASSTLLFVYKRKRNNNDTVLD